MIISASDWTGYRKMLAAIRKTAASKFESYLNTHEYLSPEGRESMLEYANALVTSYGGSSAALSCEMYDAIASASDMFLPPAEPAPAASFHEVAKTVNGIIKESENTHYIAGGVERLVKQAGADTMQWNSARDGAEWAWIPQGETCAFCLALASRGWQRASRAVREGNHAEHIHENCDCEFAVRFDRRSTVEGYDPERLKAEYDKHGGDINAWQRDLDAKVRESSSQDNKRPISATDITEEYFTTATPGRGTLEREPGFNPKDHDAEIDMAKWLHEVFGGDLTILAESAPEGEENPDYRWMGKLWDLKSLSSSTYNKTDKRIQKGSSQIDKNRGGIILDYTGSSLSLAEAEKFVRQSANHRIHKPTDIIIKKGDKVKILRYAN